MLKRRTKYIVAIILEQDILRVLLLFRLLTIALASPSLHSASIYTTSHHV